MPLEWRRANLSDVSPAGFDRDFYMAQVAMCDVPDGWHGFIHSHKIDGGPWASAEAGCRAAEAAISATLLGPRR